ncbi:putative 5-formyltetrahydrofolate cyclo-ligase [Streptococcus suis 98HAH33]|nr:putative 5-formyltetrahydrofolate cyclo-ligase [Streptococcus suis 98HAH33]
MESSGFCEWGYGGGFYDRYVADYQGETVSTLADFQVYDFVPDVFDIPVKELVDFGRTFLISAIL